MEKGEEYEILKKSIETDLTSIQTASPFSKKKILERLKQTLESCKESTTKIEQLNEIILSNNNGSSSSPPPLYEILLNLLSDNLEKSKTISLNYLLELNITENLINNLIYQLEILTNGQDIEEIRYLICQLLLKIISIGNVNLISVNTDKIIKIIKITLGDNSPDQKELSSKLIQSLCNKVPNRVCYYSSELISQLITNLSNRQQRVRSESLQALSLLALTGSVKIISTLEPLLLILATDNSPNLRIRLCTCIQEWCTKIPTTNQYFEFLLPILITLSISDIKLVKQTAINSLNQISIHYWSDKEIDNTSSGSGSKFDEDQSSISTSLLRQLYKDKVLHYFGDNEDGEEELSIQSKKLILQFSQVIMKRFYRCFHDQELEQTIRDFKQTFLIGFIGYLGGLPSLRFIDAIIECIIVRKIDHFDQIVKKTNEIITLSGLLISESIFIPKIVDKIKLQYNESSPSLDDHQLTNILITILKQFIQSLIISTTTTTPQITTFNLILSQFKFLILHQQTQQLNISILIFDFFYQISIKSLNLNVKYLDSADQKQQIEFCKLLILLDNNIKGLTIDNLNLITNVFINDNGSSSSSSGYQSLLEKYCDQLILEISKKDKQQLIKQDSHLTILNYLSIKLTNNLSQSQKDLISLINEKIK